MYEGLRATNKYKFWGLFFPTVWPTKQASIFYVVIFYHSSFVLGYCTVSVTISTSFLRHIVHESIYFMSVLMSVLKSMMILNCIGLPQKRLYFKRRVWHNIKQNLSILYGGSFFLIPNTHVHLQVQTFCLHEAHEEQSAVMKTCWQDKNCRSPTCELCFWMCVAASSRSTEAVEHTPGAPGPAPEHRGPSYLSLSVNNNSFQRPLQAISGLSWHIFKTHKIKKICAKQWEKVWRSLISSGTKSLRESQRSRDAGGVVINSNKAAWLYYNLDCFPSPDEG